MAASAQPPQVISTPCPAASLGQRVAGHGGEEHRRGHAVDDVRRLHEVGAHLASARAVRLGAVLLRDRGEDRHDDAAGAGRVGRRRGGEDEVGQRHAVGDADRLLAQLRHEEQGDPAAEPGLDDAARDEERHDDEPDRRVGEPGQRLADGEGLGEGDDAHRDHAQRTHRERLEDDGEDRRDEDRQQVPRLRAVALEALGREVADGGGVRQEPDDHPYGEGNEKASPPWEST